MTLLVWPASPTDSEVAFDFDCDWIKLYLGQRGGNHIVGFQEFAQLLKGFRGERVRQAFRYFDTDNDGFIAPTEFQKIMIEVAGHKLSDSIIERLPTLSLMTPGQRISYSEVFAFHNSTSMSSSQPRRNAIKNGANEQSFVNWTRWKRRFSGQREKPRTARLT